MDPSHRFSVRLARGLWHLVWNRRTGWSLVCLASLIMVYWQWENWRSARELKVAYEALVRLFGTDQPIDVAPIPIPDDQNFYCIPILQSWNKWGVEGHRLEVFAPPEDVLLPENFIAPEIARTQDYGAEHLDLEGWKLKREAAGKPLPPGETAATVLDRELGDAHGILPQLTAGVGRPFAIMKPTRREALESARDNLVNIETPPLGRFSALVQSLDFHLRSAVEAGNPSKAADCAFIMLRLSEGPADHAIVGCLASQLGFSLTYGGIHEGLSRGIWDDATLLRLQLKLNSADENTSFRNAFVSEALWNYQICLSSRAHRGQKGYEPLSSVFQVPGKILPLGQRMANGFYKLADAYGPVGWHDANLAYLADGWVRAIGPADNSGLPDLERRLGDLTLGLRREDPWLNPRQQQARTVFQNMSMFGSVIGRQLVRRRCLVVACGLERYRLKHGHLPEGLDLIHEELKPFNISDPFRPMQALRYRLDKEGALVWSVGEDGVDQGGSAYADQPFRLRQEH